MGAEAVQAPAGAPPPGWLLCPAALGCKAQVSVCVGGVYSFGAGLANQGVGLMSIEGAWVSGGSSAQGVVTSLMGMRAADGVKGGVHRTPMAPELGLIGTLAEPLRPPRWVPSALLYDTRATMWSTK